MNRFNKQLLSISEAAKFLGISEQTLRRWDKDGSFKATLTSSGLHRYYSLIDLNKRTKGLWQIAKDWAEIAQPLVLDSEVYCPTSDIFKTRLERMAIEMSRLAKFQTLGPTITAVAGEIGNNSFDHNIGNWPDIAGVFFAFDLIKRIVVLADRGRGVLTTLRTAKPELADDLTALRTAFTEILTARAPEHRGNGLKYVRKAVTQFGLRLLFQSGEAEVLVESQQLDLIITKVEPTIRGSLTLLEF